MRAILLSLCLGFMTSLTSAAEITTIMEFLAGVEQQIDNVDNPIIYENKKFIHKQTHLKTSFSDFTENEKKLFYVWQAEVMSKKLLAFHFSLKENSEGLVKVMELRKKHALKQEAVTVKIFAEIGDDIIPAADKMTQINNIRRWNDEHNLIQRVAK